MTLTTRPPTCLAAYPLVLLEGGEKSGRSWKCAELSGSPKIGRTAWLELGDEGTADEYGLVPNARYEIIIHDGTWPKIIGQVQDAHNEAAKDKAAGKPPFLLVIDTGTAEWELLKDWGDTRARQSDANKRKLSRDANAEVKIPNNIWNDINGRHRKFMRLLMTFPGIVIITARGKEVAVIDSNGNPVPGEKTYAIEAQKNIGFDVSCHVRVSRDAPAYMISLRSAVVKGIRPGIDPPERMPDDWTLETLIFTRIGCDPQKAQPRQFVELKTDSRTPEQIRDLALNTTTPWQEIRGLWWEAKDNGYESITLINENGDEELLITLLGRVGKERQAASGGMQTRPAAPPASPAGGAPQPAGNGPRPPAQRPARGKQAAA